MEKLKTELVAIDSELNHLEQECKLASDRVEDIKNSRDAFASTQKSRALEDNIHKVKGKVGMKKFDKEQSKTMLKY